MGFKIAYLNMYENKIGSSCIRKLKPTFNKSHSLIYRLHSETQKYLKR